MSSENRHFESALKRLGIGKKLLEKSEVELSKLKHESTTNVMDHAKAKSYNSEEEGYLYMTNKEKDLQREINLQEVYTNDLRKLKEEIATFKDQARLNTIQQAMFDEYEANDEKEVLQLVYLSAKHEDDLETKLYTYQQRYDLDVNSDQYKEKKKLYELLYQSEFQMNKRAVEKHIRLKKEKSDLEDELATVSEKIGQLQNMKDEMKKVKSYINASKGLLVILKSNLTLSQRSGVSGYIITKGKIYEEVQDGIIMYRAVRHYFKVQSNVSQHEIRQGWNTMKQRNKEPIDTWVQRLEQVYEIMKIKPSYAEFEMMFVSHLREDYKFKYVKKLQLAEQINKCHGEEKERTLADKAETIKTIKQNVNLWLKDNAKNKTIERPNNKNQKNNKQKKNNKEKSNNKCRNFARKGSCRFGKECRFKHVKKIANDEHKPINTPNKSKEMCKYGKKCRFQLPISESGKEWQCKKLHIETEIAKKAEVERMFTQSEVNELLKENNAMRDQELDQQMSYKYDVINKEDLDKPEYQRYIPALFDTGTSTSIASNKRMAQESRRSYSTTYRS